MSWLAVAGTVIAVLIVSAFVFLELAAEGPRSRHHPIERVKRLFGSGQWRGRQMNFATFEEARRAALFQASMRPTAVVQRDDRFWVIPETDINPSDAVVGRSRLTTKCSSQR